MQEAEANVLQKEKVCNLLATSNGSLLVYHTFTEIFPTIAVFFLEILLTDHSGLAIAIYTNLFSKYFKLLYY